MGDTRPDLDGEETQLTDIRSRTVAVRCCELNTDRA